MRQLYPDLYQTTPEYPLPDHPNVVSFAYLLVREQGNVLFYGTEREAVDAAGAKADLERMQELGGVSRQYLAHWHEASPGVARIRETFGASLHAHALERDKVREASGVAVDVAFRHPETHRGDVEIIPTPGHSPGSTSYLYESPHGQSYLFVGDTIGVDENGGWESGYLPGGESDRSELEASLLKLRRLEPDVVLPAAAYENHPYAVVSPGEWRAGVDEALRQLREP